MSTWKSALLILTLIPSENYTHHYLSETILKINSNLIKDIITIINSLYNTPYIYISLIILQID